MFCCEVIFHIIPVVRVACDVRAGPHFMVYEVGERLRGREFAKSLDAKNHHLQIEALLKMMRVSGRERERVGRGDMDSSAAEGMLETGEEGDMGVSGRRGSPKCRISVPKDQLNLAYTISVAFEAIKLSFILGIKYSCVLGLLMGACNDLGGPCLVCELGKRLGIRGGVSRLKERERRKERPV
jgi:hypothetical protein